MTVVPALIVSVVGLNAKVPSLLVVIVTVGLSGVGLGVGAGVGFPPLAAAELSAVVPPHAANMSSMLSATRLYHAFIACVERNTFLCITLSSFLLLLHEPE